MAGCTSGGRWGWLGQHPLAGGTPFYTQDPRSIVPVAYLCLGYMDGFGNEPELERIEWQRRSSLDSVVFEESFRTVEK
jgi:hypothetical protein